MAFSWYYGRRVPSAERGSLSFDVCSVNNGKFLFHYENVSTRGQSSEKRVLSFLGYLESESFELYYDNFASGGDLSEEAREYCVVKHVLRWGFGTLE